MQHSGIEERLQDTARTAGRGDDIDLVSPFLVCAETGVAGIGQHFSGFYIGNDGGQVMDMVGAEFAGVTVDQFLCLLLQGVVHRGSDTCSRSTGGKPFEQMGSFVGQWDWGFGQWFHAG